MDATEILFTTPTNAIQNALSAEMLLTPTTTTLQLQQPTPPPPALLSPLVTTTITATAQPTTPRTTTHTPREIPSMYILDQMYDDYMDQYNGNNITTPTEVPETNASLELAACPICSRTFNPLTLRKHVGICEKMAIKKRNKFDSSRQRREGTDLASYPLPKNFGLPEKTTSNTSITQGSRKNDRGHSPKPAAVEQVSSPIMTRKKLSEDLIRSTARASMRKTAVASNSSSTSLTAAPNTTTPSTSNFIRDRMRSSERSLTRRGIQPPPAEQCPHCERCFGIKAYDRHVEWCKEKALLASIKQGNSSKNDGNVAKARLEARIKYRAPCLKTKRSLNREKYSGLAGEEPEIEDNSKCSKTSLNKTQENNSSMSMSMSMTSSICSERTGNINESVVATKSHKNDFPVANRKCLRDKIQTTQPPPTTTKTYTAEAFEDGDEEEVKEKEVQIKESIINLEIEMPEFCLMGEQMTATAANKKRRVATSTATAKVNAKAAAKIKTLKQKQQLQPTEHEVEVLQRKSRKSYQKLETADVQINLPPSPTTPPPALERTKSSTSELSLKSMRRNKLLLLPQQQQQSHKALEINKNNDDHKCHHNVTEFGEVKFKATPEMPVENLESLTVCSSSNKNAKEYYRQQIDASNMKMTIEEYFDKEEIYDLEKKQDFSTNKFASFQSEESKENKANKFENVSSDSLINRDLNVLDYSYSKEFQNKDLIMKQYDSKRLDDLTSIYDSEDAVESVMLHDSNKSHKILSKDIKLSKSVRSESSKSKQKCKTVHKENEKNKAQHFSFPEIEKNIPSIAFKTSRDFSKAKESQSETDDIFKDCLTDSDELRRRQLTSKKDLVEHGNKTVKRASKTNKSSSKSNTFITNLNKNSFNLVDIPDNYEKFSNSLARQSISNSKSSVELHSNLNSRHSSPTKSREKINKTSPRHDTPRRSPSRSSSPNVQFNFATVNTGPIKNETSRLLKPLNLSQPKRKKVLRQTASCTNAFPMKALMLPLSMENLKICGVSSAPQINNKSSNSKSSNNAVVSLRGAEAEEEECSDMEIDDGKNNTCMLLDKEIKVIKEPPPPPLKRNRSFTVIGLPDNYDPFLSAKRQLEELCSPSADTVDIIPPAAPQTPGQQLPSMTATPNIKSNSKMSTSLILSSTSTPNTTPNLMTTSHMPQQQTAQQKTPILARSSSFRRTSSLRGPRRSPMLTTRPPLFAQKHRPTIQRGLSDEGPISTNFLKPEEYDEMPVRSVCVNDYAINKSPRVVRRDTSTSNRKQPLKLNINASNTNSCANTPSPNVMESEEEVVNNNHTASKTDSLAVFLKFEHDLEKLNNTATADSEHNGVILLECDKTPSPSSSSSTTTPPSNLDGPLSAKELKDKSNNLSKQNSAKNIKADVLASNESTENYDNTTATNDLELGKYGQVRLAPLPTKPSTPLAKPSPTQSQQQQQQATTTLQLMPLNVKNSLAIHQDAKAQKSPKPVALSSIFGSSDNKNTKQTSLLYTERKSSMGSDYIDPKLINKCDNLPITVNLKRTDFKPLDSDDTEIRREQYSSSSSSESSAPAMKATITSQAPHASKFLPTVKQDQQTQLQHEPLEQNNFNPSNFSVTHSHTQRNSIEGRNLLKRRMRLGRNQFLYDASPEGDSCSADDESANRSSMEEGDAAQQQHYNSLREREKAFEQRLSSVQLNPIETSFIPPLPAFDDFDFEEFLSSFENDEEQFPLFKDCREFLMNRTSKKQRSMLMPNSATQNNNNNSYNKNSSSPQTFPPLTPPQSQPLNAGQYFQFPTLAQQPKNLFNSFSLNTRARNKYDGLTANTKSTNTFCVNSSSSTPHTDEYKDVESHQSHDKNREIFISIETEQNDLDKSSISPNSIRNMVGNPQTVVEVEVDAAHDNKFSKISDDDVDTDACLPQNNCSRGKIFTGHLPVAKHLPNVHLNNAKNLMQKMHEDFRQVSEEFGGNLRLTMEHRTAPVDVNMNATNSTNAGNARSNMMTNMSRTTTGTRTFGAGGDVYGDSDELSSLDGYPLSSPNSRLGVSSKTSADSAYGSLSRQRSSELASQRSSSRTRAITSKTTNTLQNRPLAEETSSLTRSRQLSASSSSSSEHALPPITNSASSFHKQQQQQQHLYSNNNNNNMANDLDDLMHFEHSHNNNNYDLLQSTHTNLMAGGASSSNSHSNLESLQQYTSNSTMSTSMKMSKFCHECGSKFLLEQAKFCMDCGVKRIVL